MPKLNHVTRPLSSGGFVLVLDDGAVIGAQERAMIQALYSRSNASVTEHLDLVVKRGADKFMATHYVGYGHKSIGDCGTGTIFVEGASMLAVKAIQDWMLYCGQECSTRYMDFSAQPFMNPVNSQEGAETQKAWRAFYLKGLVVMEKALSKRYPRQDDEEKSIWEKAIKARACDVMRSFLPAGCMTNCSWDTNLRQARDHLALLRNHPLVEVQEVAGAISEALHEAYGSSGFDKRYEDSEIYSKWWQEQYNYFCPSSWPEFELSRNTFDPDLLESYRKVLEQRPEKTELPKIVAECGQLQFSFLLDFGSFRDIQRHRAVIQRMPLMSPNHGFESWYLEQMPEDLKAEAEELLERQVNKIALLTKHLDIKLRQYYYPMGYRVPCRLTGDLPALVYLVELRGTRFVHPTLVVRARQMADALLKEFESFGLVLHMDDEPGRFDVRRGEQDIVRC